MEEKNKYGNYYSFQKCNAKSVCFGTIFVELELEFMQFKEINVETSVMESWCERVFHFF